MPVELVIFDCDGVLFRSERANVAFYNEVLRRVGHPPLDRGGEEACHALSSAQLFEAYYGDRPLFLERLRDEARSVDYTPFFGLMEPRRGLRSLLERLRRTYKTAMATNRGKTAHQVLAHFALDDVFDLAVGVHDVERPKPHPDMLLKCAAHFAIPPARAVYVGDQPSDAASARAAGMRFVGMGVAVRQGDHAIDELDELELLLERL